MTPNSNMTATAAVAQQLTRDVRASRLATAVAALRGLVEITSDVDTELTRALLAAHQAAVRAARRE